METGSVTVYSTLVYNGYRRNSTEQFLKWKDLQRKSGRYQTLEAFRKATGYEEHGLEVDTHSSCCSGCGTVFRSFLISFIDAAVGFLASGEEGLGDGASVGDFADLDAVGETNGMDGDGEEGEKVECFHEDIIQAGGGRVR